jgi:hypothetical protein
MIGHRPGADGRVDAMGWPKTVSIVRIYPSRPFGVRALGGAKPRMCTAGRSLVQVWRLGKPNHSIRK